MRCWARQGRSLKDRGRDWWVGKPEAREGVVLVPGWVGGSWQVDAGWVEEGGGRVLVWTAEEEVVSSGFSVGVKLGLGVSTNMMEGPWASSSVETAARGVGFDVNFGRDWRRMGGAMVGGFGWEEPEIWEEELATLWDFGCFSARRMAVSEALALKWGLRGVTDCEVGLSSPCEEASLRLPFQIALRRSSWREKNEVLGAVFLRRSDVVGPS